jgi:quercetin dioxygenase-like cupin family protein
MKAANPDREHPYHLRSTDMRLHWKELPKSDTFGHHRALYDRIEGTSFRAGILVLPFGQSSPPHDYNGEHIIFQLEGEVEFNFEDTSYRLTPMDMLFIPASAVYGYANIGRGDVRFITIIGKVDEWPTSGNYFFDLLLPKQKSTP